MVLTDLIKDVCGNMRTLGSTDIEIKGLAQDSRAVKPGYVFFAVKGTSVDGHDYIDKAVENGAVAVVCEKVERTSVRSNRRAERAGIYERSEPETTTVIVENSAAVMGRMASAFYGHPSRQLKLVGITGTNGKTTTVTLLYRLVRALGYEAGLLSTIENRVGDRVVPSTHTTGDSLEINALLRQMVDAGCEYCFMEVSSHAVVQNRIAGLEFTGAIFSNITRDHLDYHKTFDQYIKAKKRFFDQLPSTAFALTNVDDRNGLVMLQNTSARKLTYSLRMPADFNCKLISDSLEGLQLEMNRKEVHMRLVGRFNAYNLTAIYGTAVSLGLDEDEVLCAMSNLREAPGRFETVKSATCNKMAVVDYAHTPDALENVLTTVKELVESGRQSVFCVVGCGGNRDAGKRPQMAQIACRYADKVIFTSDNPRFEEPQDILDQMTAGLDLYEKQRALVIVDREQAIKTACMMAGPEDVILIAGKGHEPYQEIKGVKHHFDDREVVAQYL